MAMKGIRCLSMPDETVIKIGPPYLLGCKHVGQNDAPRLPVMPRRVSIAGQGA